ncbi:MAG: hypothetical protein JWR22_1257 [Herminiimonas sp.]|nr:hypothetical protein [Herminiimonas sp.]
MNERIKDFGGLKSLSKTLKAQAEERERRESERVQREAREQVEADLFRRTVGEVAPVPGARRIVPQPARPEPIARQFIADEEAALRESLSDEFSVETLLDTDEALSFAREGIGQDTLRKLRRGHWVTQGQLDLHGLRTEEAREAVADYLRSACKKGLRCVRIIHGKGLGSINKEPVLKRKVRNWLVQKDEVIAFCQASAVDGGSGAVMVLLKAQTREG